MKNIVYIMVIALFFSCTESKETSFAQTKDIKVVSPNFTVDSIFFKNNATINFRTAIANTELRYTTDTSNITNNSKLITTPLKVNKSSLLKVKAYHPDFKESETIKLQLKKVKHAISNATVTINPMPSDSYPANGPSSLTDLKSGTIQFKKNNTWLGFNTKEVTIKVDLAKELTLSNITLHTLTAQGDWIFAPEEISIYSDSKLIGNYNSKNASSQTKESTIIDFIEVPVTTNTYSSFAITIKSLDKIPAWHPGANSTPWFFIDEIIVE
ncbi:FN3 associated domain-containing protein [Cellulophaga fucicola]|uniref:FN3 associated domain-containing protein n=1 Tax=Cellulophaga fucicola TaxID=76595 RepID=UPI003EBBC755